MLSKSLIQYSVHGQGCVPSLLFDLRPNYGGGNEDNGDLLQKGPCTCPEFSARPCSRPLPAHTSTGDAWTLTGTSRSVSCGVTAPFSWVLAHIRFCLYPPRMFPQTCVRSVCYRGGVKGDLLQEGLCHTQVWYTQSPCLCSSNIPCAHQDPGTSQRLRQNRV